MTEPPEASEVSETNEVPGTNEPVESDAAGTDGGYVHRPEDAGVREGRPDPDREADPGLEGAPPTRSYDGHVQVDEGLGRAGWALVGVVLVAFLVVPGVIYLRPATPGEMGFGFLTAMLVLPMVPAALLGATAVWIAVRGRED